LMGRSSPSVVTKEGGPIRPPHPFDASLRCLSS
jgi:hypothetical protein